MYKKKITAVALCTLMVFNTVGCGTQTGNTTDLRRASKDTIINNYEQLKKDYESLYTMYNELVEQTSGEYSAKEQPVGITEIGDGTGRYTLTSNDAKIYFAEQLVYPYASVVSPSSSINITDKVNIKAEDNWIANLSGSTLTLEHTSGISGTIKIGTYNTELDVEYIKDTYLPQWVKDDLSPDTVNYSYVYLKGTQTKLGAQLSAPTYIDSKNSTLKCGVLGYKNVAVSYIFVYRGTRDNTKDELIKSVLNSITIDRNSVNFD